MAAYFFLLLLVICGNCSGRSTSQDERRAQDVWPELGFELCTLIIHVETNQNCIQCFNSSGTDWDLAVDCVREWLPPRVADCTKHLEDSDGNSNTGNGNGNNGNGNGNNGNGNGNSGNGNNDNTSGVAAMTRFIACLRHMKRYQEYENKHATTFYTKGTKYLARVGDSNIIKNGGAAMFSCVAQDYLLNDDDVQDALDDDAFDCLGQFQMDPNNQYWHLGKEDRPDLKILDKSARRSHLSDENKLESSPHEGARLSIAYSYGAVGHDLPFHGAGAMASDLLKGVCIFDKMDQNGDLDDLVEAMFDSGLPVAPWIFREVLNEISSINLPEL